MMRELKVWGERWLIREDSMHAVSYLQIRPWMRCSWHKHAQKYNIFVVVEGVLEVRTEDGTVDLKRGETFTVMPGVKHEFRTLDHGAGVIEEMYVKYDEGDIARERLGGRWSVRTKDSGG